MNAANAAPNTAAPIQTALGSAGAGTFAAEAATPGFAAADGGTVHTVTATVDTGKVQNPAPASVYQTERFGPRLLFTFSNLAIEAKYRVRLHFAETNWNGPKQRIFDVSLNGTPVLRDFDIFQDAGGKNIADVKTFIATSSASGKILISETSLTDNGVDNATLNAIEILPAPANVGDDSVAPSLVPDKPEVFVPRQIHADYTAVKGRLNEAFRFSVGSDRAIIHLRTNDQRDLTSVVQQCGFRYSRFHGIFDEEMHVYSELPDGTPQYDWKNVDAVYDILLKTGIKPFVELGFMPEALASGRDIVFEYHGNVTQPKSYDKWGALVTAFTKHLQARYGDAEVRTWFFEVWNEPDLPQYFWKGNQADYFHLYDVSARAVKAVNRAYRVGGPATSGGGDTWVSDFIHHCQAGAVPVDFVSTHAYGGADNIPGPVAIIMDKGSQAIVASSMPNLPFYITEWNDASNSRDPVHDSYVQASFILSNLRRLPANLRGASYWTYSDIFEEAGPPPSPFHGGFGLLNAQGLPKPAFFAYKFLNELGSTELNSDDLDTWICRDKNGMQALVWNYTGLAQKTGSYFARDLPAKPAAPVTLTLAHLPPGNYSLSVFHVGYKHNDVYDAYLALGSPKGSPDDPAILPDGIAAQLRAAASGQPESVKRVHVTAFAPMSVSLPMKQNDIYFVTVERR